MIDLHVLLDQSARTLPELLRLRPGLQKADYRLILAREVRELGQSPRVLQAATVEDVSPAVPGSILGVAATIAEADHAHAQSDGRGGDPRRATSPAVGDPRKRRFDLRYGDRETLFQERREVPGGERHALKEARLSLVEPPVSVGAQGLHDPNQDEAPVMGEKLLAIHARQAGERTEVGVEQVSPYGRRQVGLRVVEQRGEIILECASTAALIIDEPGLTRPYHDVSGLEVAVHEMIASRLEQEAHELSEVPLEPGLVERHPSQLEEVILEVVQVPQHRLPIEGAPRMGVAEVDEAATLDLEARQDLNDPPIDLVHIRRKRLRGSHLPGIGQEVEEGPVAQILA